VSTLETIRPDPNAKAMVREPGADWRYETDQEFACYLKARMAPPTPPTTELLSVSVGRRPAVKAQAAGFEFQGVAGGPARPVHHAAVPAQPEGPLRVVVMVLDKGDNGPARLTPGGARLLAADILEKAEACEAALAGEPLASSLKASSP
jgi:hypothetical protein